MWVVEIHEYDYFTGNKTEQHKFICKEEAEKKYVEAKSHDFDYGDHYRTTKMFQIGES